MRARARRASPLRASDTQQSVCVSVPPMEHEQVQL
jgi:hypothetical protein